VLALLIVPLGVSNQRSEREDLMRRIERDAVAAASQSDSALAARATAPDAVSTTRMITALRARLEAYGQESGARVLVVDAAGHSVVDTGEEGSGDVELDRDFSSRPEIARALAGEVAAGERASATLGHPLLFVAVPVTSGGRAVGAVRVSYPSDELARRVAAYWTGLAAIGLLVLGIAALVAVFAARWIARPLDSLARVADEVGDGNLDARADEEAGPPEVRAVAARVNASVAALQRLLDDQRAFTSDASHQLRTPLQAMMLRLDNVGHELERGDAATARAGVAHAAAEVDRLAAMVESLLVLERADRGASGEVAAVDVAQLLRQRAEAWLELGARRGVDVHVDVDSAGVAQILAHPVHVEQVLDNYVDNAITVAPAGTAVRVRARRDPASELLELHVIDQGPGLSDAELETVFRRFASGADRPRTGGGGFGLGLAIVRRLAEVDGGRAWLRHGPGHGIDAVVAYRIAD
ncbi:MAG: Signal transduction histidine-protein kinase ArlS, partial [Thermoleophilia bacterium]|nr:Signal transduction histidine-protein kinase ArlS [Thermoleophilia bacterium]